MKFLAALLLLPLSVAAQNRFVTGMAARAVIGQDTFTAQNSAGNPPSLNPSASLLGAVSGLAWANNMLFVVDSNRMQAEPTQNRVLIFPQSNLPVPAPDAELTYQYARCPVCGGTASVVIGQPDFVSVNPYRTQNGLQNPAAVASDGNIVAIADTDNNRVLIYNSIPTTNGANASVVLGQKDFTSLATFAQSAKSLLGPQGVWIQGNHLFVADTVANRVLIWNSIPTSNDQPADVVLGESSFTAYDTNPPTDASHLLNPVSVTSDGTHVFVTDLGNNRVLIWNEIPTQNGQPADLVLGQPDFKSNASNNTNNSDCPSTGSGSNITYPALCAATLSFPRYALAGGGRLFVADGGNDRVLVYESIPTKNGAAADEVLGQYDQFSNINGIEGDPSQGSQSDANQITAPQSLAWDGTNLYVSDPFDRRVLVFTPGQNLISRTGITNAASREVFALGSVTFGGTINAKDTVTITVNSANYTYTVQKNDTLTTVINNMVQQINTSNSGTGDPNVYAIAETAITEIVLVSKIPGVNGNNITYSTTTSSTAQITATAGGANLAGGQDATEIAPSTLITVFGYGYLTDQAPTAAPAGKPLPVELAGVELYIDGTRAPLQYVSPTQINAQMLSRIVDATSVTTWVRSVRKDGSVIWTAAVGVPIVPGNPGIFAYPGQEPRQAIAVHASSSATNVVSVDGTVKAGDVGTITIGSNVYNYTVVASDTLTSIENQFISLINANSNEVVSAQAAGAFNRIILSAKQPGAAGVGTTVKVSVSSGANLLLTVLGPGTMCCANTAGAPVTTANPAVPGELINIYATGLGITTSPDGTWQNADGVPYAGPPNNVLQSVDALINGNSTANVLFTGFQPGSIGVYQVTLQMGESLSTNLQSTLRIAQNLFTSNIVTIPIYAPTSSTNTPAALRKPASRPGPGRSAPVVRH